MRRPRPRPSFWEGPGLLLVLVGIVAVLGGLIYLAAEGPRVIDGLAIAAIGVGVIAARGGVRDYYYARAQYSYVWPRDPERMKPNAEFEAPFGTAAAILLGGALVVGGLVQAVNGL